MKMISSSPVISPTTPMAPTPPAASKIPSTKQPFLPLAPVTINHSLTPKTLESLPLSATLPAPAPISSKNPQFPRQHPLPPLLLQHRPPPLLVYIPKPQQERISIVSSSSSSLGRFHQSAPVNLPMLAKKIRENREFDDFYDLDVEEEGEILPPHEIVARSLAHSPMLACSVLEGVGRTLKGRDLRQACSVLEG
ncbi:hypothetical protein CRYUN_Cryun11dG0106100 [Craigia yunnanensis]